MSLEVPFYGTSSDNQVTASDIRELQIPKCIASGDNLRDKQSSKALLVRRDRISVYPVNGYTQTKRKPLGKANIKK